MLYVLFCDGEFDQVCETQEDANREKADLKAMGFRVTVKQAASWEAAEAMGA